MKLSEKSHRDLLEVKVENGYESCFTLMVYRKMFPNNLTADGLPKPHALHSVTHIILKSYTGGILLYFACHLECCILQNW